MAGIGASMRRAIAGLLDQTATVYTRTGTAGFTTVARTGLKCYLDPANRVGFGTATGPQRAEPAPDATLYWDPAYEMAETVQIVVDAHGSTRWNVVAGTMVADVAPGDVVVARHVSVMRAK